MSPLMTMSPGLPQARRQLLAALMFGLCAGPLHAASTVCLDFNPPVPGNGVYGPPAYQPGSAVAFAGPMKVNLGRFRQVSGTYSFNKASISKRPISDRVPGQTLALNNINVAFTFKNLGGASTVSFDYLDMGGSENLQIILAGAGGQPALYRGELAQFATSVAGLAVQVSSNDVTNANGQRVGHWGKVTVASTKRKILGVVVGGQEFWINNVCAKG